MSSDLIPAAHLIGAGLAIIGVVGGGVGIGNLFAAFITAVGRNPAARQEIQIYLWLGFALSEATAIFALLVSFFILFT
jgi:F0F1-type ATP synthase membrane subunit c/vacuolar-type H+-ATPase subunit K